MTDADDRPDSGVFLVQQALAADGGRRASDRAWDAFLTGPWPDLKRELRAHYAEELRQNGTIEALARVNNEQTMQLGVIRSDVSRIEANQSAVLDEVFGKRGLDGKRSGGLADMQPQLVEVLRGTRCIVKTMRWAGGIAAALIVAGAARYLGWA